MLAFELMDSIGPYVNAFRDLEANKAHLAEFPFYKKYFKNPQLDYMKWFDLAVTTCVKYIVEINDLWTGGVFSYKRRIKYEEKISTEDLTSPWKFRPGN